MAGAPIIHTHGGYLSPDDVGLLNKRNIYVFAPVIHAHNTETGFSTYNLCDTSKLKGSLVIPFDYRILVTNPSTEMIQVDKLCVMEIINERARQYGAKQAPVFYKADVLVDGDKIFEEMPHHETMNEVVNEILTNGIATSKPLIKWYEQNVSVQVEKLSKSFVKYIVDKLEEYAHTWFVEFEDLNSAEVKEIEDDLEKYPMLQRYVGKDDEAFVVFGDARRMEDMIIF